jgi:NAD(P)-dependent dehydrogenase (short-subunit alcohol dehydrogenase family)
MNVNTNGVLFTAQAAGRQMVRFGNKGSIILIASMSGTITNKVDTGDPHIDVGVYRLMIYDCLGPCVGLVQHEQIGSITDGSEHGVRAGTQGNTSQHALSRTYIHLVSVCTLFAI